MKPKFGKGLEVEITIPHKTSPKDFILLSGFGDLHKKCKKWGPVLVRLAQENKKKRVVIVGPVNDTSWNYIARIMGTAHLEWAWIENSKFTFPIVGTKDLSEVTLGKMVQTFVQAQFLEFALGPLKDLDREYNQVLTLVNEEKELLKQYPLVYRGTILEKSRPVASLFETNTRSTLGFTTEGVLVLFNARTGRGLLMKENTPEHHEFGLWGGTIPTELPQQKHEQKKVMISVRGAGKYELLLEGGISIIEHYEPISRRHPEFYPIFKRIHIPK